MYADAKLTRTVNLGGNEGFVDIKGDDWGYGVNFGAIFQATEDTRFGLAYRSHVKHTLQGDAQFTGAPLNGTISASLDLPETLSASVFSRLNEQWDVMADATWTGWDRFQELRIVRTSGALLSLTPEKWQNTMRYSVGATYHVSPLLKLRTGLAFDQDPTQDQYRTARIPGNDRTWLSLGANYKLSDVSMLDIGYTHLFIKDASINDNQLTNNQPNTGNGHLVGNYTNSVDILSAQYTYSY